MRRLIHLPLVLLVVAGCGGSGEASSTTQEPQQPTPTNSVATTTTSPAEAAATTTTNSPPTTTTVPPSSTTTTEGTEAEDRYVVGEPGVLPRPDTTTGPRPGSGGAAGSGCSPGSIDLPDGVWFGLVTAKADASITFDLACFFFGQIAVEESAADGVVLEPDGDVYIRNSNPTVRTITVDPSVTVHEYFIDLTDTIEVPFSTVSFAEWPEDAAVPNPCPGELCGVWLFVNGGAVTEMLEQFYPPSVGSTTSN